MRNKHLQWGHGRTYYTMMMSMLKDVFNTAQRSRGGLTLSVKTKLSNNHFNESNRSLKMKVKHTVQVLSNTMVETIDGVISGQFKLQPIPLSRQATALSKVRELCVTFDRWFDRCNSKDRNESRSWKVKVHPENAVQIAGECLSDL